MKMQIKKSQEVSTSRSRGILNIADRRKLGVVRVLPQGWYSSFSTFSHTFTMFCLYWFGRVIKMSHAHHFAPLNSTKWRCGNVDGAFAACLFRRNEGRA